MNPRISRLILFATFVGLPTADTFGQVSARVDRVGLFAGADPVVRDGNWSFVEVSLKFRGAAPFDGQLHLQQQDRDGDIVTSVLPVALAPNEDWRPYQIYFVPREATAGNLRVSLHDADGAIADLLTDAGEPIKELTTPTIGDIRPDDLLILDLTTPRRLPHLAALDMDAAGQRERLNARQVRGLSPRELPTLWQGLEPVDAIVWDDADPSELSQQQVEALIGWVKAGGRLLITGGKNWQSLAQSPLAAALPVTIRGVGQVSEAQEFLDLVENDTYESQLARRYAKNPITRCRMSPLPDALPIPAECPNAQICYRRFLGRGVVVFLGASLRQLLPPPKKPADANAQGDPAEAQKRKDDPFIQIACEKIVGRRLLALPAVREETGNPGFVTPPDLFNFLRTSIAFESVGTRFLILAILFAIAYTFVATTGSYWYLKRRAWEHHCWTAFGAASLAASIVGTGMVGLLRGVQKKLWQTTIVDAQTGVDYGYASCLFGIKTPNHTRLDFRLPVGDSETATDQSGPLRAMPASTSFESPDSHFTAAAGYECDLGGASLREVPIRATLKELQGRWHGPLGGVLDAKLVLTKTTDKDAFRYEFGDGSFIRNQLGVDLHDCYLLETTEEVAGERPTTLTRCYFLGDLLKSGPESQLDETALRTKLYFEKDPNGGPDAPPVRRKQLPMLDKVLDGLAGQLRPITLGTTDLSAAGLKLTGDAEYPAMLMLSLFDLMPPADKNQPSFRRSHGRSLSCTHRLGKTTALLIGHTEDAPAATLEVGGKPLKPDKSHTIYRFVIPVRSEK